MLLNIAERFRLLDLLTRQQGSLTTMGIIRKLNEKFEFSIEEYEEHGIVMDPINGRVSWKNIIDVSQEKEIELSEKQINYISDLLKNSSNLTTGHFPILERFGVKLPEEE